MDKHKWPLWALALYAHLGEREQTPGDNGAIMNFGRILNAPDLTRDEVHWCAAAVGASLERAGVPSTKSLMAKSYLHYGEATASSLVAITNNGMLALRLGAIAVFDRPPDPNSGHVNFVVDWNIKEDWVDCLGGNQGNAVTVSRFRLSSVRAFRYPTVPPRLSPTSDICLKHVLGVEGGYTNDPNDSGSPTSMGAPPSGPRRVAGEERLHRGPQGDNQGRARRRYVTRYWFKSWSDQLPPALALMHFDCGSLTSSGLTKKAQSQVEPGFPRADAPDPEALGPEGLHASPRRSDFFAPPLRTCVLHNVPTIIIATCNRAQILLKPTQKTPAYGFPVSSPSRLSSTWPPKSSYFEREFLGAQLNHPRPRLH